jgi:hypothetical protein
MTTSNVLRQINTQQVKTSLDDLFKAWSNEKSDQIKEYFEDILVLSCCIQRLANNQNQSMRFNRSLDSDELPSLVNDLDRQKAKNIREYYKNKLLMLTLRENNLTKFRKDLQNFLYSEPNKVLDSHCGLVYKLPYFYDYDLEVDDVFKSSYFKNNKESGMNESLLRTLKLIKKIENRRKHSHSIEYWFQDDRLNKVMLEFPVNNPLLKLFDNLIDEQPLKIVSRYYTRRKDLNEFFMCDKWTFA